MHDHQPALTPQRPSGKYVVYVDDNFHYMDESERYKLGEFDTEEEAIHAANKLVDDFLKTHLKD
jgi:hypothetical protein